MARFSGWRPTRAGVLLAIGIIVLAAVVAGVLYLAGQRGEQARREEAVKVAEAQLEADSNTDVALNEGSDEPAMPEDNTTSNNEQNTANTPASTTQPATNAGASELPQTGPTEAFAGFAVALLTFSTVSYVASRKALSRL